METNNKPDFQKLYPGTPLNDNAKLRVEGFLWGCEEIWNDYVIPERQQNEVMHKELREADRQIIIKKQQLQERDAKIAELEKKHQIELSNYAYQTDLAKRDRDKAESENQALKSKLDKAVVLLRKSYNDIIIGSDLSFEIRKFLKDKR